MKFQRRLSSSFSESPGIHVEGKMRIKKKKALLRTNKILARWSLHDFRELVIKSTKTYRALDINSDYESNNAWYQNANYCFFFFF